MHSRWLDLIDREEAPLGLALMRLAERAARMHHEELLAGGVRIAARVESAFERANRFDSSAPRPGR